MLHLKDYYIQCSWPQGRPLSTQASAWDSWTLTGKSGSVSCGVTAPFSWVLVFTGFQWLSKNLFPQTCGRSVVKSHWPSKSNSLGFSVLSPDPQFRKSVVGPRTFATVWGLLWYNCSLVCRSPAWWLYGGVNGDLLQEGLCHTLCLPGAVARAPVPVADHWLPMPMQWTLKDSKAGLPQSLLGCLDPGVPKVLLSLLNISRGHGVWF